MNKMRKKIKAPRTGQRKTKEMKKKKRREKKKKKKKRRRESNNILPQFSSCLKIFQGLQDLDPYSFFQPCAIR
jgi:hypothetical protein